MRTDFARRLRLSPHSNPSQARLSLRSLPTTFVFLGGLTKDLRYHIARSHTIVGQVLSYRSRPELDCWRLPSH
ncbi:hypothetical protein BDV27DRAFT_128483 [Aspergillus caelatus]|uniref:Uncharacterized protein n=1 Tax=Aspergillus caelatus TaxID=61420 RepID=A0A5N7A4B6_9EURO|nr:uncharacterized protein BDV27DRAFT_128483 [Aspergillus caelatus]KAE8364423.1 hypothetical protein BDV27DRAFT_128483 [Aspergillus caelatus]